jgi:hypothetical protein
MALQETWARVQVDAVAVAAHARGIFGLPARLRPEGAPSRPAEEPPLPSPWTREAVRDAIATRLDQTRASPSRDWPLLCPYAGQRAALLDYSRELHDRVVRSAGGGASGPSTAARFDPAWTSLVFDVLLCHVDADKVVSDPAWKEWFRETAGTVPALGAGANAPLVVQDDGGQEEEEGASEERGEDGGAEGEPQEAAADSNSPETVTNSGN